MDMWGKSIFSKFTKIILSINRKVFKARYERKLKEKRIFNLQISLI